MLRFESPGRLGNLPSLVLLPQIVFLCLIVFWAAPTHAQEQEFIRGDANGDAMVNVADVVLTLDHLFTGAGASCRDALDTNDDGRVDVADAVFAVMYLFGAGTSLPAPFPSCGVDPTADGTDCVSNEACSLGGPIMGLTEMELLAFNRGKELFVKRFTRGEGVGPFFNATSCMACHEDPAAGGSAPNYRNFYLVGIGFPGAQFPIQDPLLPSIVLPSFAAPGEPRPSIPNDFAGLPITVAQRNAPPMFGTGLFEFVPNSEIFANADPDDTFTPDGISGRYNTDGVGNVGRFGYKSQANFLEAFLRGAAQNQMGLTTDPVLGSSGVVNLNSTGLQVGSGFDDPTTDNDGVTDPEISVDDFADIIAFSRFLAPPRPKPFTPEAENGEVLFDTLGCVKCHVPTLNSSMGPLNAYTDLLIHDMGPDLADGISMGFPQGSSLAPFTTHNEFRTQPLWGVSNTAPYLHDGRAGTLQEAIEAHGGEAEAIKNAYLALPQDDQNDIIEFLEAL